jgi:hypothetical protein
MPVEKVLNSPTLAPRTEGFYKHFAGDLVDRDAVNGELRSYL